LALQRWRGRRETGIGFLRYDNLRVIILPVSWTVVFYKNARGEKPVGTFLKSLSEDARAKCVAYLKRLAAEGNNLPGNIAAHMEGDLWELRPEWGGTEYRFFYFTLSGTTIYVVHAVTKKRQKSKDTDIQIARARIEEIRRLYEAGEG
jgi:phage-related protein